MALFYFIKNTRPTVGGFNLHQAWHDQEAHHSMIWSLTSDIRNRYSNNVTAMVQEKLQVCMAAEPGVERQRLVRELIATCSEPNLLLALLLRTIDDGDNHTADIVEAAFLALKPAFNRDYREGLFPAGFRVDQKRMSGPEMEDTSL